MKNDKGKSVEAPHAIDQWRAIDGRLLFRCPDCNTPVKVTGAGERDSIFCPACGAGLTIPSQALKEVSGAGDLLEIAAEPTPGESGMKGGRATAPANPVSGDESSGDGDEPEPHEVIYTEIRPAPLSVAPSPPDADQSIKPEFPTIDRRPELKRPLDRKRRGGGGHHSSSSDRVRVKKWRKQSPGGHENLFDEPVHQHQAPKRSSRFVYIAAAVFLLVVALVIALTAMPRKNKETPNEEGGSGGLGPEHLQIEEHVTKSLETAKAFLNAKNWEERLPLVLHNSRNYPLVKSYYATHPDGPIPHAALNLADSESSGPDNYFHFSVMTEDPAYSDIVVTIDQGTAKVDWMASMEDSALRWRKFGVERPADPAPFRVLIARDDYYTDLFPSRRMHVCYRIRGKGRPFVYYGYAPTGGEAAKQIDAALMDSLDNVRAMRLEICFPENAKNFPRQQANQVEITEFLGVGWRNPANQ